MSYKNYRDDLAKKIRDLKVEKDRQLEEVEKLWVSEETKEKNREEIMENFYDTVEGFKNMKWYKEAKEAHEAEKRKNRLQKEYEAAIKDVMEKEVEYENVMKLSEDEVREVEKGTKKGVSKETGKNIGGWEKDTKRESLKKTENNVEEEKRKQEDVWEIPQFNDGRWGNSSEEIKKVTNIVDSIEDSVLDEFAVKFWEKGWSLLVLKHKKFKPVQKEFEAWLKSNQSIIELEFDGNGYREKILAERRMYWVESAKEKELRIKFGLFMKNYFVEKTRKLLRLREKLSEDEVREVEKGTKKGVSKETGKNIGGWEKDTKRESLKKTENNVEEEKRKQEDVWEIPQFNDGRWGNSSEEIKKVTNIVDSIEDSVLDEFAVKFWEKGWSLLVLKHKKFKPVQKEFEAWLKSNQSIIELEFDGNGYREKILAERRMYWVESAKEKELRMKFGLFMKNYFVEKTRNFSKLREKLNPQIISKLEADYKNFENKEDKDSAEAFEKAVMEPIIFAIKEKVESCVKKLKPWEICDKEVYDFGEKLIEFLWKYESCIGEVDVTERDKKLIRFVNEFFWEGMLNVDDTKRLLKRLYRKAIFDDDVFEEAEFKEKLIKEIEDKTSLEIWVNGNIIHFFLKMTEERQKYFRELRTLGFDCVDAKRWLDFVRSLKQDNEEKAKKKQKQRKNIKKV